MSQRLCVATPVGQWPVWQRWAWMQPTASIASRPTLIMSQPSANASSAASGKPEPAAADEHDVLGDARARRTRVHAREAELERQRDVIGERQRRGARAALAAVDGDEVRARRRSPPSAPRARSQNPRSPDRRLDAHRQPGRVREPLDELDQLVDVRERRVARPG